MSWLHLYSEAEIEAEVVRAEEAIEQATGVRTTGFRGPGYSLPTLDLYRARFDVVPLGEHAAALEEAGGLSLHEP